MSKILILKKKDIKNAKSKGDNAQIRLKVVPGELFYIIKHQRYDTVPHSYDGVKETIVMKHIDISNLIENLDLTFAGSKKILSWANANIDLARW